MSIVFYRLGCQLSLLLTARLAILTEDVPSARRGTGFHLRRTTRPVARSFRAQLFEGRRSAFGKRHSLLDQFRSDRVRVLSSTLCCRLSLSVASFTKDRQTNLNFTEIPMRPA